MKILLILAFVSLSQVLSETENFGETASLSDLKSFISTLHGNEKNKNCFNTKLRVEYYYAVGNFTEKVKTLGQDQEDVQTTAEDFKNYPSQMVTLILTQNNTSAAEDKMDNMKEKVNELDNTLQSTNGYNDAREKLLSKVKESKQKFLECVKEE